MTSAERGTERIAGYEAPIYQALWARVTSFGVPRMWATMWVAVCLYVALLFMVGLGFIWMAVPALVWMLGHGVLMGLSLWDVHWDEMAIAQLTRRYKGYYDAG